MRDVVVVGAGIAGLTAARDLVAAGRDVLVLEGSPEVGGKLRRAEVAGVIVDVGAEAMLARRPEGVALAAELGIEVVHPTAAASQVWSRGALRPLPRSLMGVPFDLDDLAASGVLSAAGLARARAERVGDAAGGRRLGRRPRRRAARATRSSSGSSSRCSAACTPAARAACPPPPPCPSCSPWPGAAPCSSRRRPSSPPTRPVFAGIAGGMGRLAEALADGLEVRTRATVRALEPVPGGWRLTVGSAAAPETVTHARASCWRPRPPPPPGCWTAVAPEAARDLAAIESASVAVVTLAFEAGGRRATWRDRSGFLVPPVEGRGIKASTFSFAKWDWVREAGGGLALLRTSLGRHGEEATLQAPDEALVATSLAELADARRHHGAAGRHARPAVGRRAAAVRRRPRRPGRPRPRRAARPASSVCGAAYDGVGIPAVIGSAHRAAAVLARAE